MLYRLLEWVIAPVALIIIAIYQVIIYWEDHRVVAIFFFIGGAISAWLFVYGIRRIFMYRQRMRKQNN